MSTRKPHNDTAGYVTERVSHHPKLPGHFVIIDHKNGGEWLDAGHRWIVIHARPEGSWGCMIAFTSLPAARDMMYHMAAGGNDGDFGQ